MRKCKLDRCSNPALPTGKRYCAQHKREYEEKQAIHRQKQELLEKCTNFTSCGNRISERETGHLCKDCAAIELKIWRRGQKIEDFYQIQTVEELKEWMLSNMEQELFGSL